MKLEKKINTTKGLKCPMCGKELVNNYYIQDLPYFGKTEFIVFACLDCNYKNIDINPMDEKEPIKEKIIIEKKQDLFIKIVRGKDTTIELEEFGLMLEPGSNPEVFFTNMEGLLERFKRIVYIMLNRNDLNEKEIEKLKTILNHLEAYKEAKKKFTIILKADKGFGKILSEKVVNLE